MSSTCALGLPRSPRRRLRKSLVVDERPCGSRPPTSVRVVRSRVSPTRAVMTGIDVLRAEGFARLRGQRVGLVTNQTGRARDGVTTIDLLHEARDVHLVVLLSPEHGIRGTLEGRVSSSRDERTGLPIYSLYGDTRRPTEDMLAGLDTLVIDLQDIGARFYTYMTTMAYVMEEAAQRGIAVVVLDRPNPVNGVQIEGPTLDEAAMGFTGYFRMPIRHGLTLGELARLFDGENEIGGELTVVAMDGWRRGRLVRRDRSPMGESVAQYAQHEPSGALSWPRGDRDDQYFGRPGDGRAVSADWGSVDRRPARRGRAQRSRSAGRSFLPRVVYAFGGPVRRGNLPGGASDRHGSALASTCACGSGDCVGAAPPIWRAVPAGCGGNGCLGRATGWLVCGPVRTRATWPPAGRQTRPRWRQRRAPYLLYH